MKRVANIVVSFTVLILLLFGTGGLSLMRCSCSGKVSLVLPSDNNCCPIESNCMTVNVWKVSDAAPTLQETVDVGEFVALHPVAILPTFISMDVVFNLMRWPMPLVDSRPPGRVCSSVEVLRV